MNIASARAVPFAKSAREQSDLVRLLKGNRDFAGRHSGRWAANQRAECLSMGTRVIWSRSLPLAVTTLLARPATSSLPGTAQSPGRWIPCAFRWQSAHDLWGEAGRVGQLRHGTCQKGGGPNSFGSKLAAHAHADIGSNVAIAQKRVRLPPLLMPVTHLLFSFPSRRESMHLFYMLVVARFRSPRAKPPVSMPFCPDLAEESRLFSCQKVENKSNLDSVAFKAVPPWMDLKWHIWRKWRLGRLSTRLSGHLRLFSSGLFCLCPHP